MNKVSWLFCAIGLLSIIQSRRITNSQELKKCLKDEHILHKYLPNIRPPQDESTYGGSYFICQEDDNGEEQYISLFSMKYNMALFSAFIYKEVVPAGRGTRSDWKTPPNDFPPQTNSFSPPKDEDYTVFSDFNRGHLFPHNYAKDEAQGKATMRHTNAVPQDAVFNKWIWKNSEDHLKTEFLESCHKDGNVAMVVTGAVPVFNGLNVDGGHLRIGMASGLKKWNEHFPVGQWDADGIHVSYAMRQKLTVPTHMWTYFLCVKEDTKILKQATYIGLNYRTGVIKWYTKFEHFAQTLGKMYGSEFIINEENPLPDSSSELSKLPKVCLSGQVLDVETMDCEDSLSSTNEVDFWDDVDLYELRKRNEKHRLTYQLTLFGLDVKRENKHYVVLDANSEAPSSRGKKRVRCEDDLRTISDDEIRSERRKRSAPKDTSEIETALTTLEIIDKDHERDFVLKECTIQEKSCDGEIQEEHVYDLEHNIFIEDKKTDSGSTWTASHLENGEKVRAKNEVSNIRTIDIILKPRD